MRLRTALIGIIVILFIALIGLLVVLGINGSGPLASFLGGEEQADVVPVVPDVTTEAESDETSGEETGDGAEDEAPLTETQSEETRFIEVVVAEVPLPAGTMLRAELLTTELRPATNVAVQAGYAFNTVESLDGAILGTSVAQGQEILDGMLALNPTDVAAFGSDLALLLEPGQVAVAVPIDELFGVSYAMRPGDRVDVLLTMLLVEVDPEFQSRLPNIVQEVDEQALLNGEAFLFPPLPAGRLELLPFINQVAFISPGEPVRVPRATTQLTVQQAEVLWVGTWPGDTESPQLISPTQVRLESRPDLVILGMPTQDALVLKWAMEMGLEIDLGLRAQGDTTLFVTTSVTLPQMIEQSGITVPEGGEFRLEPGVLQLQTIPEVPDLPPSSDPRDELDTTPAEDGTGEAGDEEPVSGDEPLPGEEVPEE